MHRRTTLIFWTAVVAAALLLGGGIATARRVADGGTLGDYVALSLSLLGLVVALLVAGRIVLVMGRAQRRARGS